MEQFTLVVVSDDEADLAAMAEVEGLERSDQGDLQTLAIDPITATILIGGALAIGKFVLSVLERLRGGVQIDLTSTPPVVKRDRDIPAGFIYIFTADGKVDIQAKDEPVDSVERMITAVLKLPVGVATEAVKAAVESAKADGSKTDPAKT